MFDSLSDRIRQDEQISATERYLRWAMVAVFSFALFGGLYVLVQRLQ